MIPRPLSALLARLRPIALLAVATACVDTPTSPPQIYGAGHVSSSTAPVPIGAPVAVPLPLDNHPLNGIGGRWFQMQTVPGGGFYLIKVTGSVTHKYNPACGADDSPTRICDASLDGVTAGPLDHVGAGYVSLGGAPVGLSIEGGREPWPEYLRPHGGGAAVFVRYDGPATLWARRSIMVGCNWTIWSSCGDGYVPQYFLSGSNQVEVLYVPVPASVEGPAVVAPGQSVTFTGRTVEDYPVDEPYAGYRSIWWTYLEGDTLPQAGRGGAEVGAWNCSYQLSCDFTPQVSGRMRMLAYINGYEVTAYSEIVRVQESEIELDCNGDLGRNRVTRGQQVNCAVGARPSGTLTDIQWAFEGSTRSDGDPTSTTWAGPMVRSGTVQVSAKVGAGPLQSATAAVEVVDRTWPELPKMELQALGAADGDADVPALPAKIVWASDLGTFTPLLDPAPGEQWDDAIQNVVGGPNDGLDYFADLSFPVRGRIRINNEAMSAGSGFYRAQERNSTGGGTVIGGNRWCSARVVTSTLPALVRAHEDQHEVVYRAKFEEVVRAELAALERMTGSYSDLADVYDALRVRADSVAISASLDIHKLRGNPNTITASENGRDCNLKNEDGRLLENKP